MKRRLVKITLASITKVLYTNSKKELLDEFNIYLKSIISDLEDLNKLRDIAREAINNSYIVEELKLPLINTAYYDIGEKVLWHNKPGVINSYSRTFLGKRYGYQINYNIELENGNYIDNSRFDEIVNANTLEPNIEGISVI